MVRNTDTGGGNENPAAPGFPGVTGIFEACVGCKWTLAVLHRVRGGVHRPGALERAVDGITTKVLNERLSKLVAYRLLERVSYPEVPPRVEYHLTPFGRRFVQIMDQIEQLHREFEGGPNPE